MFEDNVLKNKIQTALNLGIVSIPENKKVAFVISADNENGGEAKAAFVVKVDDEWKVGTLVDWSHDTGARAGLFVEWSK